MSYQSDRRYAQRVATVILLFMVYGGYEFFKSIQRNRQRLENFKSKNAAPTWVMSDRKCTSYIRMVSGYNVKNVTCLDQYQSGEPKGDSDEISQ